MSKSLAERITSARNSKTVRIRDLEKLIPEAELERDRLSQASVAASSESVDFALSDDDRDEAAAKAERYGRTAKGLDIAIAELRGKLGDLRNSEAQKADEAERRAALIERNEIAGLLRDELPQIVERLVGLLAKTKHNAERMRAAGVHERDAECEARNIMPNDPSALRFTAMKIPSFDGLGRAWPEPQPAALQFDYAGALQKARENEDRQAELERIAAKEHARLHGIYRVSTGLVALEPVRTIPRLAKTHKFPTGIYHGSPWRGELPHTVADELRKVEHINVELMQPEAAE